MSIVRPVSCVVGFDEASSTSIMLFFCKAENNLQYQSFKNASQYSQIIDLPRQFISGKICSQHSSKAFLNAGTVALLITDSGIRFHRGITWLEKNFALTSSLARLR